MPVDFHLLTIYLLHSLNISVKCAWIMVSKLEVWWTFALWPDFPVHPGSCCGQGLALQVHWCSPAACCLDPEQPVCPPGYTETWLSGYNKQSSRRLNVFRDGDTFILSLLLVCVLSRRVVVLISFGSSVSASSVPNDCRVCAVLLTINANPSISWGEQQWHGFSACRVFFNMWVNSFCGIFRTFLSFAFTCIYHFCL